MGIYFLIAFIAVPILEIAVFIEAGGRLGVWPTVGTVVLTAVAGMVLLRVQGLATLFRVQESLNRGLLPIDEVFDGLFLLAAGALLLIPGFVTDAAGLLLFVPALRKSARRLLERRLKASGKIDPAATSRWNGVTVIDGNFHEVRNDDVSPANDDDRPPPSLLR